MNYSKYDERQKLYQYKSLLEEIMKYGEDNPSPMLDGNTGEPLYTREIHGIQRKYNILKDGAPVITERDISGFYKSAIGELFAFINGVHTNEGLREFGCKFWSPWVTEEKCQKRGLETGDLGPGSYGSAFHDFPTADGQMFNQFKEIDLQMRERPELKTHLISPWIPYYTIRNSNNKQKVVVCPCHGWIHFNIINGRLDMTMWQRSCDVILGLPSNLTQYTALLLAMAKTHNLEPGVFCHQISNAHIYNNTFEYAEEMLNRDPEPLPTLNIINEHDSIFDYRKDDFELSDYHPKEKILKIPVGV
ncbi:MAG: thymidylate synthase [Bacilli bacterium]|nr:thymidylate synthase [Bacilli bacterium]